jgi:uncharacterized protein YcfJ
MGRFSASLGLVLALSVHAAAAEPPEPLKWVRLTTKPGATLQGAVRSLDEKTLVLERPNKSPILVPRDTISRLDVRRRESKRALGFALGLVAGGAIGYAIGASSDPGCPDIDADFLNLCHLGADLNKPAGGVLGAVLGGFLGLAVAPGARWERNVALDGLHVGIQPTRRGGIGVAVSLRF